MKIIMRSLTRYVAFVCCSVSIAVSNPKPTNPYTMAGISEISYKDYSDWYIELDGRYCLYDYSTTELPCSVRVFIQTNTKEPLSRGIFRANVWFEKNQYGIMRPASIVKDPRGRMFMLNPGDTIKITRDTVQQQNPGWKKTEKVEWWKVPLRQVSKGNVLVCFGSQVISSSRKSPGYEGNYTTEYRIALLDTYGNPVSNFKTNWGATDKDSPGIYRFIMRITESQSSVLFTDQRALSPVLSDVFSPCTLRYRDRDSVYNDTLRGEVTQYHLTVMQQGDLPFSNIGCYTFRLIERGDGTSFVNYLKRQSAGFGINSNTWLFRVYKSLPVDTVCISHIIPIDNKDCIQTWVAHFVDTADIIKDTILVQPSGLYRDNDNCTRGSGIHFSVLNARRKNLRFVLSSPLQSVSGYISLFNMSGKEIGRVPFEMKRSGTSTIPLDLKDRPLSPGVYLCKAAVSGYASISRQITVR
ncbi:MAG: hypothetical protein JW915_16195 [Chitinispirillaceae bacterium]|nr:hypothetical protein [Chitinispirillaceae bacterium]